ncbi:MAG TPA: metallophosphoesterase [Anaeromyxobacter sp.]|nr:metallophosphoesterase [Anaeromyxobacter sp.]
MADTCSKFRLAAVGDLHCREDQHGKFREMIKAVNGEAEGLVVAGDLTDHGSVDEARTLCEQLAELRVPCAAVLGNHDFEGGAVRDIARLLAEAKIRVLDGDYVVFDHRLGIAGAKGFGGGFDRAMLQAFGEPVIKAFVQEAVNEGLKLEAALSQLEIEKRIVLLHYAPIPGTMDGEDPAILPFLGTSRLLSPCESFGARAVIHGHAHHGRPEGATPKGVPVYNVALPVLRRHLSDRRFRLIEI